MTSPYMPWNATSAPSTFTQSENHTGGESLSISNSSGPQAQPKQDRLQIFKDYFGAPAKPWLIPYADNDVQVCIHTYTNDISDVLVYLFLSLFNLTA